MVEQHTSRRQMIEQERGRQAWIFIKEVQGQAYESKYRSLVRGFNAMVQINGLGQTLGFLLAKGKQDDTKEHYHLLSHLTTWMRNSKHFQATSPYITEEGHDGLLNWLLDETTSRADYRRATAECLAFANWLGRFAEAALKEAPGETDES